MAESINCIEYALLGLLEADNSNGYQSQLDQIRQANGNHGITQPLPVLSMY